MPVLQVDGRVLLDVLGNNLLNAKGIQPTCAIVDPASRIGQAPSQRQSLYRNLQSDMLAVQSGVVALSPMLSFDLSAPSMTALLQEDESVFNMLGCLMPEAQHVEYVPAVQHMLRMKVGLRSIT